MSQRPSASRPASHSPTNGSTIQLPPVQLRDDPNHGARSAEDPSTDRRTVEQGSSGLQRVSMSGQGSTNPESMTSEQVRRASSSSRALGMHTILNPAESESGQVGAASQSTRSTGTSEGPNQLPPSPYMGHQASGQHGEAYPASVIQNRRILTPRSPRAASMSRSSLDQRSPFAANRPAQSPRVETLAHPSQPPQAYGFPPVAQTPGTDRRSSAGGSIQGLRGPLSQSSSPSTSISSYVQPSQSSPNTMHPPNQPPVVGSFFPPTPYTGSMPQSSPTQVAGPPEPGYSAPLHGVSHPLVRSGSQGQITTPSTGGGGPSSNYQIWTIKHDTGSYQIPVDVQAASKVADEKRARNAGASARFRQRRKEKEREASHSIQKLESQVREQERKFRDMEQERDFYRNERNRLRDILYRTPATRDVALQCPPSPRLVPPANYPYPQPPIAAGSSAALPTYSTTEPPPERAPRRRRTESREEHPNQPPPMAHGPPMMPGPAPGYNPGPMQSNLPPIRMENSNVPPGPVRAAPGSAPPPGPYPYDSYSRSEAERGWQGGAGPR